MALSPIKMFQSDQSSLAQILQGGNGTITRIMDQAIQIGRDISNKQLAQERDMLAMRAQETALAERRGDALQQNIEDTQRFARNAYEFDTKFGADQNFREQTMDRQLTQDLFNNKMEERRVGVAEGGLQITKDRIALEQEKARREAQVEADILGVGDTAEAAEGSATTPSGSSPSRASFFNPATALAPDTVPAASTASPDREALVRRKAELEARLPILKERDGKAYTAAAVEAAQIKDQLKQMSGAADKPVDPLVQEGRELTLDKKRMDVFTTKAKSWINDPEAFTPTQKWLAKRFGVGEDKSINFDPEGKKGATAEQLAQAQAYQEDPIAAEMRFADKYGSADEYANANDRPNKPLSPRAKAVRRKFWEEYMATQKSSPASGGSPSAVDSIPGL